VNEWLLASIPLLVLLFGAGLLTLRGDVFERLVAMQLSSTIATILLLVLAQGFNRDVYFDLALVIAVMSSVGSLFYVRTIEVWL
jgi:multicomponent Na+:H+ antiporter subunit F